MHINGSLSKTGRVILPKRKVAENKTNSCTKTIDRWVENCGFPAPIVINNRHYFYEDEVDEWLISRVRKSLGEAA